MIGRPSPQQVCALVLVVGMLGLAGPGATQSQFVDSHVGTASFDAADKFNGGNSGGGPASPNKVYDDVNNNGQYDKNVDQTVKVKNLNNYDEPNANLVISQNIGELEMTNDPVSIRAGNVTARVDVSSTTDQVTLEAVDGNVEAPGSTIMAENDEVSMTASEDVVLDDGHVISNTSTITVDGQSISATNAMFNSTGKVALSATTNGGGSLDVSGTTLDASTGRIDLTGTSISAESAWLFAENNDITLTADYDAGGPIAASAAHLQTNTSDISLVSHGDQTFDNANLIADNGAITADLTENSTELSVDGTVIRDLDDTLVYDPDGITVTGSAKDDTSA